MLASLPDASVHCCVTSPPPAKPFFAYDPENGIEWFETMQEAQAYAAESLREYRRSASFDGEWAGDVEAVKVGHVTHFVAEHGDDESGYDYRLVTAIPAPEGGEPEPAAWLVTWKGYEHCEYCHAHASEMPAVDQARESWAASAAAVPRSPGRTSTPGARSADG